MTGGYLTPLGGPGVQKSAFLWGTIYEVHHTLPHRDTGGPCARNLKWTLRRD